MSTVDFRKEQQVAVITLNRPQALNAFNAELVHDLSAAFARIAQDQDIRAALVTGAGRAFSSGADLKFALGHQGGPGDAVRELMREEPVGSISAARLPVPCVMAVNGVAAGGGVGLALSGDVVLAARSARFVLTFGPRLGMIPDVGATWYLPHYVGLARALPMAMLGEEIDAQRAEQWGLIWQAVDDDMLMGRAMDIAVRLARAPTRAMLKIREAMHSAINLSLWQQLVVERDTQLQLALGADFMEGVSAFVAKREPKFT